MSEKASEKQVGGDHYKGMEVQPAVFCELNGLSMLESNVVKRMCRWKTKGTPLKDLKKAQHEIGLLIEIHCVEDWDDEEELAKVKATCEECNSDSDRCGLCRQEDP
jgi:hypothetical protein